MNLAAIKQIVFSCKSLDLIDFNSIAKNMSWDDQAQFLSSTLCSEILLRYPIKKSYQILFMKTLIEALEKCTDEVHDCLYEYLCKLKNEQKTDEKYAFKHFICNDLRTTIVIKEANSIISNGTTGLCTWEAALALADWAYEHRSELKEKTILELGSGTGYAGIYIGKMCHPKHLLLSDCHNEVLQILKENVKINFCNTSNQDRETLTDDLKQKTLVSVKRLVWGENLNDTEFIPNYLVASDIIYDDTLFEPLINTIQEVFQLNSDCIFILACTIRNESTLTKFLYLLSEAKYIIEEDSFDQSSVTATVKIYRIKVS